MTGAAAVASGTNPVTIPITIHVCVACRSAAGAADPSRPGLALLAALDDENRRRGQPAEVKSVECLSVCKRPATVAFSGEGRWSYVCADLSSDAAPEILDAAALYAEAPAGIVPWRLRPPVLKRGVVARIPPALSSRCRDNPS